MIEFRVISLASSLSKWYTTCLVMFADTLSFPADWNQIPTGGHFGVGPDTLIHILKLLMEKAYEWPGHLDVVITNADAEFAFDNLHPKEADSSLALWGLHPTLVAAFLERVSGYLAKLTLAALKSTRLSASA